MKRELCMTELNERIARNFARMSGDGYNIERMFNVPCPDWPGDFPGRALLAFVSHYRISGQIIPTMPLLLEQLPQHTTEHLYVPSDRPDLIVEQSLAGHSWMLRGLCEHYEAFGDVFSLHALKEITEHLYLPLRGKYGTYPVDRTQNEKGGVSGNSDAEINGWLLSTDTGTAFMSVDGLSHVYKVTRDARVLELLDEMIDKFISMDKAGMRLQTHCTLTAARGMMRLFGVTGDGRYLRGAKDIYDLYTVGGGMTPAYQNLNWWGRPTTWTEPCAIVDSLMLALELYKVTGDERMRNTAARIYCNGLATSQRFNGGAGTDLIVTPEQPNVAWQGDEAYFCCSMRLAEGLRTIWENRDLLWYETTGAAQRDDLGRYFDGDVLLCEQQEELGKKYIDPGQVINADGHVLTPLLKYYKIPLEEVRKIKQKILF